MLFLISPKQGESKTKHNQMVTNIGDTGTEMSQAPQRTTSLRLRLVCLGVEVGFKLLSEKGNRMGIH